MEQSILRFANLLDELYQLSFDPDYSAALSQLRYDLRYARNALALAYFLLCGPNKYDLGSCGYTLSWGPPLRQQSFFAVLCSTEELSEQTNILGKIVYKHFE